MADKNTNLTPEPAKKPVQKKEKKPFIFVRMGRRISRWFREMKSELKKVVWPSRKQLVNNTLVALVVMVAAAIVIWGFDEVAYLGVQALIALKG